MASLGRGFLRLRSMAKCSPGGTNSYASVTKASLQVGSYQLWSDLERDGFRQIYLLETYAWIAPAFSRHVKRTSQVLSCAVCVCVGGGLTPYNHTRSWGGVMMMMMIQSLILMGIFSIIYWFKVYWFKEFVLIILV